MAMYSFNLIFQSKILFVVFKLNFGKLNHNLWEFKVYKSGIMEQNILRNTSMP